MLETIVNAAKSDERLAVLLDEVREIAQVYLLAKQRHKGCAGTGELMTLREEFKDTIDKMIRYSREKDYITGDCDYDPDSITITLLK